MLKTLSLSSITCRSSAAQNIVGEKCSRREPRYSSTIYKRLVRKTSPAFICAATLIGTRPKVSRFLDAGFSNSIVQVDNCLGQQTQRSNNRVSPTDAYNDLLLCGLEYHTVDVKSCACNHAHLSLLVNENQLRLANNLSTEEQLLHVYLNKESFLPGTASVTAAMRLDLYVMPPQGQTRDLQWAKT